MLNKYLTNRQLNALPNKLPASAIVLKAAKKRAFNYAKFGRVKYKYYGEWSLQPNIRSEFLYDFRGGKYGRGRVLGTVYSHYADYFVCERGNTVYYAGPGEPVRKYAKREFLHDPERRAYWVEVLQRKYSDAVRERNRQLQPTPQSQTTNRYYIMRIAHSVLPAELFDIVKHWDAISKSPYSNSFYNTHDISWDYKPEGSLRVSDHWNFYSRGVQHCIAPNSNNYQWALLQYNNGVYVKPDNYQLLIKTA